MDEMRIIGVDTMKLTKTKAVLIVKFLTPQSFKDSSMQIYCTSLEPKRGLTPANARGGALGIAFMKRCGWPHGTATRRRLRGGAGITGSSMLSDTRHTRYI